jgi:hypothetical protein
VAKGDIILCICSQLDIKLSIVEYNMSLLFSDSLPRGSYVDDRNNPPIISATYLLFTKAAGQGCRARLPGKAVLWNPLLEFNLSYCL